MHKSTKVSVRKYLGAGFLLQPFYCCRTINLLLTMGSLLGVVLGCSLTLPIAIGIMFSRLLLSDCVYLAR